MSVDITELQAVDFALSSVISNAFTSLSSSGPENYINFLSRDINQKIFRATHETPTDLVKKIANAEKGDTPETPVEYAPTLPVVAYYRKPGLTNGDDYAAIFDKTAWNEDMTISYSFSTLPVSLDYSMTFATWDKPTLDKMQLAWYYYISHNARKNSRFTVPYLVIGDDEPFEAPANFVDTKTVIFSDTTPDKSEVGRMYSVSTDFTINTIVVVGEQVTVPDQLTIQGITKSYLV